MTPSALPEVYAQCGLYLRSEVPLDLPIVGGHSWDVEVVWGPETTVSTEDPPGRLLAERRSPLGTGWWYRATDTGDGYMLRFLQSGDVLISADLARIEVQPDRSARHDLLPVLLAGTVCAFLLALRGQTVLHASAVSVNGAGIAFVGPSGWGKTTLATLMCLAGAAMVADDVTTVEIGRSPVCRGGATELRLRKAASELASTHPGLSSRRTVDDRVALQATTSIADAVPLKALVFPGPSREATAVCIRPVPQPAALIKLMGLLRVEGWNESEVLGRDFSRLSRLVNLVPVYTAIVPWGPPFSPMVVAELTKLATQPT